MPRVEEIGDDDGEGDEEGEGGGGEEDDGGPDDGVFGPGGAVSEDDVARGEEFVEGEGLGVGGVDGEEESEDAGDEFEDADVAFEALPVGGGLVEGF